MLSCPYTPARSYTQAHGDCLASDKTAARLSVIHAVDSPLSLNWTFHFILYSLTTSSVTTPFVFLKQSYKNSASASFCCGYPVLKDAVSCSQSHCSGGGEREGEMWRPRFKSLQNLRVTVLQNDELPLSLSSTIWYWPVCSRVEWKKCKFLFCIVIVPKVAFYVEIFACKIWRVYRHAFCPLPEL